MGDGIKNFVGWWNEAYGTHPVDIARHHISKSPLALAHAEQPVQTIAFVLVVPTLFALIAVKKK